MPENPVTGPLDAQELLALLKVRYPAPSWALIPQVGDRTGGWSRCADAIGVSCWPSLGLAVHGFEIKSYRGDWLREVKNGEKSQALFRFCDYWWIVAGNDQIVQPGELPPTWGLLVAKGGKLHVAHGAPPLTPEPLTKTFIASVLRESLEIVTPDSKLKEARDEGKAEGRKEGTEEGRYRRESAEKELANLRGAIAVFEKAAGVKFTEVSSYWDGKDDAERFGHAMRLVLNGDRDRALLQLQGLRGDALKIVESVDKAIEDAAAKLPLPKVKTRRREAAKEGA